MNTFFQTHWKNLLIGVLLIALLFLIFRSCSPGQDTSGDRNAVDSLARIVNQQRAQLSLYMVQKNIELDSIKEQSRKTQIEADYAKQKIKRLISAGRGIVKRVPPDSSTATVDCDSLANAFLDLSETTESYIAMIDTIQVQNLEISAGKDSIIARQTQLLFDMQHARVDVTEKYIQLEKAYRKSETRRKRNAALNKILAGAVVIAGGIILAK